MAYHYVANPISPFNIPYFDNERFWTVVYFHNKVAISINNDTVPLFKVDIDQDYYFVFSAIKQLQNLMNIHVCVGNTILNSFKVEFDSRVLKSTRKLLEDSIYNLKEMFTAITAYPLVKIRPTLAQMLALKAKFHHVVAFSFNAAYVEDVYRDLNITISYIMNEHGQASMPTTKHYIVYFLNDYDIAFQKRLDPSSEVGGRVSKFVKFTQHKELSVLASFNLNNVYFVYQLHNIRGIISADIKENRIEHKRIRKQQEDITVVAKAVDLDAAFIGVFDRYFSESLINYPSEYFIDFAEEYGIDIQNVTPYDCLMLVDMATV